MIPGDRLLVMHYEDMIDDFETSTKRIFNFLGLEWDPAVLEFHKSKRHVHTASNFSKYFTQVDIMSI